MSVPPTSSFDRPPAGTTGPATGPATGSATGPATGPAPDGTPDWHRPLGHTAATALSGATAQSSGMRRFEAISGRLSGSEELWMGQAHVAAGARSADHHHGRSETGIYVVSGHPVFVFFDDGEERRIETAPGDYIFVPPWVPHREENPADDEAVVVLARTTQEGIVVNLPSLRPEAPDDPTSTPA